MNEDVSEGKIRPTETLTTTAPQGASAEEIREGVRNVERARAASALEASTSDVANDAEPSATANGTETPTDKETSIEGTTSKTPVEKATTSNEGATSETPVETTSPRESAPPPTLPTRTKSRLSIFGRSKPEPQPTHNISPYPGT